MHLLPPGTRHSCKRTLFSFLPPCRNSFFLLNHGWGNLQQDQVGTDPCSRTSCVLSHPETRSALRVPWTQRQTSLSNTPSQRKSSPSVLQLHLRSRGRGWRGPWITPTGLRPRQNRHNSLLFSGNDSFGVDPLDFVTTSTRHTIALRRYVGNVYRREPGDPACWHGTISTSPRHTAESSATCRTTRIHGLRVRKRPKACIHENCGTCSEAAPAGDVYAFIPYDRSSSSLTPGSSSRWEEGRDNFSSVSTAIPRWDLVRKPQNTTIMAP